MQNKAPKAKVNEPKPPENTAEQDLQSLFNSMHNGDKETLSIQQIFDSLQEAGISPEDDRLQAKLGKYTGKDKKKDQQEINLDDFGNLLKGEEGAFIRKALSGQLAIPDFKTFCSDIEKYYENTRGIKEGEVKSDANAGLYAVSVCTVDGQQFQLGDHDKRYAMQSVCKAINYPIALHERGEDKIHQHVGREPSGRGYNGLVLNEDKLPHNPMINAGAIMICSLIKPEETVNKRLKFIQGTWSRLCGNTDIGFDKEVYESEPMARNMALSYYMKEKGAFPEDTDLYRTMELYTKCCSIEIQTDQLAMAAASLANGGVCPTTGDTVFSPNNVRDCLSLMLSCGMYDYSGEFAFLVGLPAKSGVSGAMMVVVPGLMGIAIYSPPLDELGNPVRGVEFCKELVNEYALHKFDHVTYPSNNKKDPRQPGM